MEPTMNKDTYTTADAFEADAIPKCDSAVCPPDAHVTAEQQPLPDAITNQPMSQKSPAEWAYERLILYIQNFEEQLDAEHEVGMGIAGADVGAIQIQGLGYFAPDIVTFYGADSQGARMQLVQHVSQLNVMLVAAPKREDEPSRIGFHLAEQLANKPVETPLPIKAGEEEDEDEK